MPDIPKEGILEMCEGDFLYYGELPSGLEERGV